MKAKGVVVLACVTAVIAGGAYVVTQRGGVGGGSGGGSGVGAGVGEALPATLVPMLAAGDVEPTAVVISRGAGELRLFADDGSPTGWRVEQQHGYPANAERVRAALVGMEGLRPLEAKTENPALFGRLGVEEPSDGALSARVRVVGASGALLGDLVVGEAFFEGPERRMYARRADLDPGAGGRVFLCEGGFAAEVDPLLWVLREFVAVPAEEIGRVEVTHPDGHVLVASRVEGSRADFEVENAPGGAVVSDMSRLRRLGNAIARVQLTDVVPVDEAPVDFGDAVRTAYTLNGGVVIVVESVGLDDAAWLRVSLLRSGAAEHDAERWDRLSVLTDSWAYRVGLFVHRDLTPRLADVVADAGETGGG